MSENGAEIRQKINVAADLHGVVRAMKAMAASSILTYEKAVSALEQYDQTVQLSLAVALRELQWRPGPMRRASPDRGVLDAIVFGSDQGLVGQFNDVIAEFAIAALGRLSGTPQVWVVGERVHSRLVDAGLTIKGLDPVPNNVSGIASLVWQLQMQTGSHGPHDEGAPLYLFHNQQRAGAGYAPVSQRLLPLDGAWRDSVIASRWPGRLTPQILAGPKGVLPDLVREYLFISVYRACAESLASENASRLAAMQRAEKNIDELTEELTRQSHRVRQMTIDEDLFDVVSGFEATT